MYYMLTGLVAVLPFIVAGFLVLIICARSTVARVFLGIGTLLTAAVTVGLFSYWTTFTGISGTDGMGGWYSLAAFGILLLCFKVVAVLVNSEY